MSSACRASSSALWPVSRPSHARAEPAADRSASITKPPRAPRETTMPGSGAGTWPTGTDTPANAPHDTMGRAVVAATPSTSQARSPAPATTGVPALTPRDAEAAGSTSPTIVVVPTISGRSSAPSSPAPSRAIRPGPRRHRGVGDGATGQSEGDQVSRSQDPSLTAAQSVRFVPAHPRHLRGDRTGIGHHSGEHVEVLAEAGHLRRGPTVRGCDRPTDGFSRRRHGDERVALGGETDRVELHPFLRGKLARRRRGSTSTIPRDLVPPSPGAGARHQREPVPSRSARPLTIGQPSSSSCPDRS